MNFGELQFWILLGKGLFLIVVGRLLLSIFWKQGTENYDKAALAVLGLSLLIAVSWQTFVIFALVKVTTYFGIKPIAKRPETAKRWLWLLIPLQLTPLVYYKYSHFLINNVARLDWDFGRDLVIPVGISFYTFQVVSFVVDTIVFKKEVPAFLDFINFVSFFPQLVAGPIERRENLLPQMQNFRFGIFSQELNTGASWIAVGLFFKCCMADNLAVAFDGTSSSDPFQIWRANLYFGLRIYFDFAGYSLIALGLALCLGCRLTLNFTSPYCSQSIVEFWRRWHISLSNWFRDYLYVPLGGGRVKWWAFNVALVFVVSGIWHGAGWNFLIWGLLHAVFLIVQRLFGKKNWAFWPGWLFTMVAVFYSWLCFYEARPGMLAKKLQVISNPFSYSIDLLKGHIQELANPNIFVGTCFFVLALLIIALEGLSLRQGKEPYHYLRNQYVVCVLIILTVWLAPGSSNGFIYFAF